MNEAREILVGGGVAKANDSQCGWSSSGWPMALRRGHEDAG